MPRLIEREVEEESPLRWPIVLIILLALGVRLFGIGYGLPFSYSAEEERVVTQGFRFTAVGMKPDNATKPVLTSYVLGGEYGAYFGVAHLFERVGPLHEFQSLFLSRPSIFILIGRLTSTIFGLITIYLLYYLGKHLLGWGVGVMAATLLTLSPHHIKMSQLATGDNLAMLFFVASLFFFVRLTIEKRLGEAFTGAVLLGFAAGTSFEYVLLFPIALIAYLVIIPREYKASAVFFGLLVMAGSFVFGLLLPNAGLLFTPRAFAASLPPTVMAAVNTAVLRNPRTALPALEALVSRDVFTLAVGWGLVATGVLGLLWGTVMAKWVRMKFLVILVALLVPAVLMFPRDADTALRWAFLMTPMLSIGSAYLIYRMFWRRHIPAAAGLILMIIAVAAVSLQGAAEAGVSAQRKTGDDTRHQFSQWSMQEIPHLSRVFATPQARYLFQARNLRPGMIFAQWRAQVLAHWNGRGYRVTLMTLKPDGEVPIPYDFDYIAVDQWSLDELRSAKGSRAEAYTAFIESVEENWEKAAVFEAPEKELAGYGPTITVYRPAPVGNEPDSEEAAGPSQ